MQWILFLFILMGQSSFFTCQLFEYYFIGENKTWDEAQKYCRENYTDLATVYNMTDMERLCNSAENQDEAWIGLHSYPGKDNRTWYWSPPGLRFNGNQTRWNPGEPNDHGYPENNYLENCAMMINQKWFDVPCKNNYTFFCYSETNQFNTFYYINTPLTWPQAQSYCRQHYTDLVSGLNQLDDPTVKSISYGWLGLFRDTWRWSDGTSLSFRNWEYVEDLVDGQSNKTCATVLNTAGKWSSDYCDQQKPFYCYIGFPKANMVRLKLTAEDPSVNMADPAVAESILEQIQAKFRDRVVKVKVSWGKLPKVQNTTKEIQREDSELYVCPYVQF